MRTALEVRVARHVPRDAWEAVPPAQLRVAHLPAWHRVLERCFGFRVGMVEVVEAGERVGWWPVVRKRRLGRVALVALPLTHDVPFASGRTDVLRRLDPSQLPARFEVHGGADVPGMSSFTPNVVTTWDIAEHATSETLFGGLGKKSRWLVRKAGREGFRVAARRDAAAWQIAHRLHVTTRMRQRSPMYPRSFFAALGQELGRHDQAVAHIVSRDGVACSVAVAVHAGERTLYGYSASSTNESARKAGANQLALWGAIEAAHARGDQVFDYGSSPVSQPGLSRYKERMGGTSRPLPISTTRGAAEAVEEDGRLAELGRELLDRLPRPAFERLSPALLKAVL